MAGPDKTYLAELLIIGEDIPCVVNEERACRFKDEKLRMDDEGVNYKIGSLSY